MIEFIIKQVGKDQLDLIQPLWEKLVQHHSENSTYFKSRYQSMIWENRKEKLISKSADLALFYITEAESNKIIGYCISSVAKEDESEGEIDSIFIEENFRKLGLGQKLMRESVCWLEEKRVTTQKLVVSVGNEGVLNLYKKFGFYPLHTILQKK